MHGEIVGSAAHAAEPRGTGRGRSDPLEELARERDDYLLALQRTQADFENYKQAGHPAAGRAGGARRRAHLVDKLLPVLDALDLAETHLKDSLDVSEGAKALHASRAMLGGHPLEGGPRERSISPRSPSIPTVHDAVAHAAGEGGPDGETMVAEVLRAGYRWKGQVLRPAMVRVRG